MKKVVLPVSGGMDSTVLLHKAATEFDEIHCLTFNYNQRHNKEIEYAKIQIELAKKTNPNIFHQILDVSFIRELAPTSSLTNDDIETPNVKDIRGEAQPKTYVPNRNMIFLSICAARAEAVSANIVWHGAAQADSLAGYWDSSEPFIDSINNLLNLNRHKPIKIEAPIINMSKAEITLEGIRLGVDFTKTWTCYSNRKDGLADATTASSSLRLQGFIEAGYQDPIRYLQQEAINNIYREKNCKSLN